MSCSVIRFRLSILLRIILLVFALAGGLPARAAARTFHWIVQSGDFNTASNWDLKEVPGEGDTAIIAQGTFSLSSDTTNQVSTVTVSAPFTAPSNSNYTLNIAGNWTFSGAFTLANGWYFLVTGGGKATITGTTQLNGASVYADYGAQLSFPNVTTYAVPSGQSMNWQAGHDGTVLSFPNLKTITGPVAPNTYFELGAYYSGNSNGTGALLTLPALTTITKADDGDDSYNSGVVLDAHSGSTLSAPALSVFNDNDSHSDSSLNADGGGILSIPKLTTPQGVNTINLNAVSHPEQFTSLAGTISFELNEGAVSMTHLASIAGFGLITVDNGAQLSFPNVTSYAVPAGFYVRWLVQHDGSVLSFPNLKTITGPTVPDSYFDLQSYYNSNGTGALLSLPALTTITKADDGDNSNNSGVRVRASAGATLSAPNLSTFNDNDSHSDSSLNADGGGILSIPKLTTPQGVNTINLNAVSHPEQFTSLAGTISFELNEGAVSMTHLASIAGFGLITVDNGAQLSFPNVTSYAVPAGFYVRWLVQHDGSVLSFPNLKTITGPTVPDSYFDLQSYYNSNGTGALLSLPALTTITKADDGDNSNNSGVRVRASAGATLSAPNLSTFNDNDSHSDSSLNADGGGILSIPKLTTPQGVNTINLNAVSHPEQFTSLAGTISFELNEGAVSMTHLASIAGFGLITVDNGAQLSFPNVTSYAVPAGFYVRWLVQHDGSVLSFPNLKTITGPTVPDSYFDLQSYYNSNGTGALLSLPALTTITKADDGDNSNNSGVRVRASAGATLSAPNLSTFNDNDSHPNSSLTADSGGVLILTKLMQAGIVGVTVNGATLGYAGPGMMPVITSAAQVAIPVNSYSTFKITATNSPTVYVVSGLPGGLGVSSSGVIAGTPVAPGIYSVALTAGNGTNSGHATLILIVGMPEITSAAAATGQVSHAFSYQITATKSPTSFGAIGLPAGLGVNAATGLISGTPTMAGTYNVTIKATNGGGDGTATLRLTILPLPPVISSAATATGQVGVAFSYQIVASNSPTSYAATGLPAGLSVAAGTGLISGTPTAVGTSTVTVSATNAGGTGSETVSLTVKPATPVITSSLSATVTVGTAFSYQITASNSPTSFGATGLPSGLTINAQGLISGTVTTAGSYSITIKAANAGGTGTATLKLAVNPPVPVISSSPTATAQVGVAFSYHITGSNSPTSYAASGLPTGLSVNASTGVISGTPANAGSVAITISATNAGGTGSAKLNLTINPATPVITSATTVNGTVGTALGYRITASNTPTSYSATGLPPGLTLGSGGLISGTPTTGGTYAVTVSATNAGGTGTATVSFVIKQPIPVITSALTETVQVNAAFSYQITATNSPTSFGATGLPTGLSINAKGVISGTVTTAGTYSITVKAANVGGTGTATLKLTVNPPAPVITSAATASGTVGKALGFRITASNTPTSYAATNLPPGLTISSSGLISGTPTTVGTYDVTVSAANSGGTGTATLTFTINPPPPVITSAATVKGTVGKALGFRITASNNPTSFTAANLPPGLTLGNGGLIEGTPTKAGTYNAGVSATNAGGRGTGILTFNIAAQ